jgi:hypothetical protein
MVWSRYKIYILIFFGTDILCVDVVCKLFSLDIENLMYACLLWVCVNKLVINYFYIKKIIVFICFTCVYKSSRNMAIYIYIYIYIYFIFMIVY